MNSDKVDNYVNELIEILKEKPRDVRQKRAGVERRCINNKVPYDRRKGNRRKTDI